jgi:hypothetical protein
MDLGLDDRQRAPQLAKRVSRFLGGASHRPPQDGHPGLTKQLLGLVFVDFHERAFLIDFRGFSKLRILAMSLRIVKNGELAAGN